MLFWSAVLFCLGILAFLDTLYSMGEIFRQINSALFMLISLGLLVRTTTKMKAKKSEQNEHRIVNLEQQVKTLRNGQKKLEVY
ncbi:MAG TPA: hypothetical protein VN285_11165 [Candidatus Deferrimicrobium sp.]|nr:hypothetical protein [Candidatus Deferrimicrobium sp.]